MTGPGNSASPYQSSAMPFRTHERPATPDVAEGRGAPAWKARVGQRPMVTVATYPDYLSAQSAVDLLSDEKFPVDRVTIVGTDVRLVEKVLGRMTTARSALAGAGTGAWFGLLIGILLGIFAVGAWWQVVVFAVVAGIVWGAVFGAFAHAMTGGRRDFSSASAIQANTYSVMVEAEYADQARQLLRTQER
ncbi:general stress protein [Dactylosporangium sp. CA-052675]|uniref:general stress protein n=1 Tax=Dactylosporangium sp. CA-052675 TaxID=3239927 RepID=UPI003D8AC3E2